MACQLWTGVLAPHYTLPFLPAGLRELQLRGVRPARQQQDPPMRLRPYVHRLCHFPVRDPLGVGVPVGDCWQVEPVRV